MPDAADTQRRWSERIRLADARLVDAFAELFDKPVTDLSLVEAQDLRLTLAVMQALARRPHVLAAVGNVAQVYTLNDEGVRRG
ncbi:MAG: hypothetical protein AAF721_00240 [Myxococcota bacterium]